MMRRRMLRYAAAALVLLGAFAGIAYLTYGKGPEVLRAGIHKKLLEEYSTATRIEETAFCLFPLPHVSFAGVRLENDGALFTMESMDFYPDLGRLFMGQAVLSTVKITNPDLRVLSWSKLREILNKNPKDKKTFCESLNLPDFTVGVSGGHLRLPVSASPSGQSQRESTVECSDLTLKVVSDTNGLRVKTSVRSPLARSATADVRVRKQDGTCLWDTEIEAEGLALAPVGRILNGLFPSDKTVHALFPRLIRSGRLSSFVFSFNGRNDQWRDIRRMTAEARAENAVLRLPGSTLDLQNLEGFFRLNHGVVSGEKLTAGLGGSRASGGRFTLDLNKTGSADRPFELETRIAADLSDLSAILGTYLPSLTLPNTWTRFDAIQGRADLKLSLKNTLRHLQVFVDAQDIKARAFHSKLGRPVSLVQGAVEIQPDRLSWKGLKGTVGPHVVSECSGTVHLRKNKTFDISSVSGVVDGADALRLASKVPSAGKTITKHLNRASGNVRVTAFSMNGDLSGSRPLQYRLMAVSEGLSVSAPGLPGAATVLFDGLSVTPELIHCPSMTVTMNRQTFTLGGSMAMKGHRALSGTASIRGVVDGSFRAYLKRQPWIPRDFFPKLPVELDPLTLAWDSQGLSLVGTFHRTAPGIGEIITTADVFFSKGERHIRQLVFETRKERAEISAQVRENRSGSQVKGRFSGNLKGGTLAALFEKGDRIRGDMDGYASFEYALSGGQPFQLKGPLSLNNAVIHTENGVSITVEKARFNGQGQTADMKLQGLSVETKTKAGANDPDTLFFPHIAGNIVFQKNGTSLLRVSSGNVCGIAFAGDVRLPEVDMDLTFASERQAVTSVQDLLGCFGVDAPAMTGILSVEGTIIGNPGMLAKGSFKIKASKGVVNKTTVLTKMLGLLDLTELFSGNPVKRIMERGYRYDTMDIEGTVTGHNIHLTKAAITGAGINLYATGYADLSSRSLDLVVLASPFKLVDSLFYHIPLAGPLISGKNKSLLSVPLVVEGDFDNPQTRFLPKPISTVSSGVMNTFVNVFKLPFVLTYDLVAPKKAAPKPIQPPTD